MFVEVDHLRWVRTLPAQTPTNYITRYPPGTILLHCAREMNLVQKYLCFAFAALFCALASAYPYQPSFAKLQPNVDCHNTPTPLSYHIHVTYMLTNDQQIKDVQNFRDVALKHFAPLLGDDPICQGTDVEPSGRYGKPIRSMVMAGSRGLKIPWAQTTVASASSTTTT